MITPKEKLYSMFVKEKVLSYEYRKKGGAYANDKIILSDLIKEGLIYQHTKDLKSIYFVLIDKK